MSDDQANRAANLGYFFDASVARTPDKTAIYDLYGGTERQVTYAMLDERADRVAGLLHGLGIRAGQRVGMVVGNRSEFLEIFFGTMRTGAIPVPINTRLARDTLKFILEDAECAAVFVEPAAHPSAVEVAQAAGIAHRISTEPVTAPGWLTYAQARDGSVRFDAPPRLVADAQAFQPYTSGSTGLPKGAMMTHAGMLWYVDYNQRYWPTSSGARGMIALPLFHKNAMRGTVKPALFAGASFVLMPGYDPKGYLEALAKYRCTYSRGVAAVFTMLLQQRELIASLDLSALKSLTIGSAVVTPELMDEVERALPGVKVGESYGLTEGGSPFRVPLDGRPVRRGSAGVLAPEIGIRLTSEDGTEVDVETPGPVEGELWLKSPYNCIGYHKRPDATREKLVDTGCVPATLCGATRTDTSISSRAWTTCFHAAARTSIPRRSRTCCSGIRPWPMPWLWQCRIRSRAGCRRRWSCSTAAPRPIPTRSGRSASRTARSMRILGWSGSCRSLSCR